MQNAAISARPIRPSFSSGAISTPIMRLISIGGMTGSIWKSAFAFRASPARGAIGLGAAPYSDHYALHGRSGDHIFGALVLLFVKP